MVNALLYLAWALHSSPLNQNVLTPLTNITVQMAKNGKNERFSKELRTVLLGCFCAFPLVFPCKLHAKEPPATVEESALKTLARDFVARIGSKLKAYDDSKTAEGGTENALSLVPDGELLLLRPKAGKFVRDSEIAAIKNNGRIYINLNDLIANLELPIEYDSAKKTGSGWFLREDWLVRMDFNKGEVVSRGQTYKVKPEDIYEDSGDLYISQDSAENWLEVKTKPDIAQQYLAINTPYPFPALARYGRTRDTDGRRSRDLAVLPRIEQEGKMFDINTIETQQSMRARRSKDKPTTVEHQNITSAEGEVLNHNAYGVTSWDSEQKLSSIRARLSKESENADLLGELKARSYTIGDTDTTVLPLTGGQKQEFGFRVNNNPLRNADFQTTVISGDALPGWDVELYRDGGLIDRIRVEEAARYEFPDIELFAGDNLFEVFFYGPQGEIRRDAFNLPVNEEFLTTQDNTYDVSVSLNEAQTYNKIPSDDEDANSPHIVARYNKLFGDTLTYAGIRAKKVEGEPKAYLGTGFTDVWNGFIFDGNAAMDEKASSALDLRARKNIADWRLSLRGKMRDEDFVSDDSAGALRSVQGSVNKNFLAPFNTSASLGLRGLYEELPEDVTKNTGIFNYNHQMGRFSLNNSLYVQDTQFGGDDSLDGSQTRINDTVSGRYSFGKVFVRAGLNYNVKPDARIDGYFSQITYQPNNRFSGDLQVEHKPDPRLTRGRLSLNYRHDTFRVTPFVEADTDSKMAAGVKLSTTFVDDPGKAMPIMTSDRIIGRGLVSSFVFHDKDGNGLYDAGKDEPLPDVIVESVNIKHREATNAEGFSLIKDLPENFVTDIRVDPTTLPDTFMIPGFAGVSVFPRAGQMIELAFPVHMSGEIDGTIYVEGAGLEKQAARASVKLIPVDGRTTKIIDTVTASDGYYVLSSVPPGSYLLNIDAPSASKIKAGGLQPIPITIGFDGTVVSGQDLVLQRGRKQVPIEVKTVTLTGQNTPFFALETNDSKKSKLSALLEKMVQKKSPSKTNPRAGLVPLAIEGQKDLKILPGQDWAQHFNRCQALNDANMACKMLLFVPKEDKATKTAAK